uniref:Uncharacterized protein n=1 Tax=Anguilla anguilla TaxID=7936 RepID=A0A0E9VMN5_ANGAN
MWLSLLLTEIFIIFFFNAVCFSGIPFYRDICTPFILLL